MSEVAPKPGQGQGAGPVPRPKPGPAPSPAAMPGAREVTPEDVPKIIAEHVVNGHIVEELVVGRLDQE